MDAAGAWHAAQQLHVLWSALINIDDGSGTTKDSKNRNTKSVDSQNSLGITRFETASSNDAVRNCADIWGHIHKTAVDFQSAVQPPPNKSAVWASTQRLHVLWAALEQYDCASLLSGKGGAASNGPASVNSDAHSDRPHEQRTDDPRQQTDGSFENERQAKSTAAHHDYSHTASSHHDLTSLQPESRQEASHPTSGRKYTSQIRNFATGSQMYSSRGMSPAIHEIRSGVHNAAGQLDHDSIMEGSYSLKREGLISSFPEFLVNP